MITLLAVKLTEHRFQTEIGVLWVYFDSEVRDGEKIWALFHPLPNLDAYELIRFLPQ